MNKKLALEKLASQITKCKICQARKSGKAVPGEGSADAKIVIIGEAPGRKEAATGRPFVGRSGQYLRKLIREFLELEEDSVFITSPVKYLPDYKTPKLSDITHGQTHLNKQLAIIKPKIIVLLGAVAQKALLDQTFPVLKKHAKIIETDGRKYFITLHPAAALRFPPLQKLIEADFKKLKKLIAHSKKS